VGVKKAVVGAPDFVTDEQLVPPKLNVCPRVEETLKLGDAVPELEAESPPALTGGLVPPANLRGPMLVPPAMLSKVLTNEKGSAPLRARISKNK